MFSQLTSEGQNGTEQAKHLRDGSISTVVRKDGIASSQQASKERQIDTRRANSLKCVRCTHCSSVGQCLRWWSIIQACFMYISVKICYHLPPPPPKKKQNNNNQQQKTKNNNKQQQQQHQQKTTTTKQQQTTNNNNNQQQQQQTNK